jgi:hypothetical protein
MRVISRAISLIVLSTCICVHASAQVGLVPSFYWYEGGSAPPTIPCSANSNSGLVYISGTGLSYFCHHARGPYVWDIFGGTVIPPGMISLIASGTCPIDWTEVTALAGFYILLTKAANGDVGTTGETVNRLTIPHPPGSGEPIPFVRLIACSKN